MNVLKQMFAPPAPNLSPANVQAQLNAQSPLFLLDVREPEEYRASHIAGAKLIPLGELPRRLNELPKERPILCVCQSGSRSSHAARQLIAAGYTAFNLQGGMLAWKWARLLTQKGSQP